MVNKYVFHNCKAHNSAHSVSRNIWTISCNWYLLHGLFLWSYDFIFLPSAFHSIAIALIKLMKFYSDPVLIRNTETGIPEFKTRQTLVLPLLSLHRHFTDAKLFKMGAESYWPQSNHGFPCCCTCWTPTAPCGRAESPQTSTGLKTIMV